MRLIHRRALVVLVAVAFVSSSAVLPSVAGAAKKTPIQKLSKRVTTLSKNLNKLTVSFKNVQSTVNQGIPIITQLVSGLQTAAAGLNQLKAGLTTLSAAVSDPTTGLPGLNGARSLIGAVVSNTASGEFTLAGHAANIVGGGTGAYVLSFVNGQGTATDVSKRVYEVTSANPGQLGVTFSAVNCAASAGATALCTATVGSADAKATDVLVATSADNRDFQIAAISG